MMKLKTGCSMHVLKSNLDEWYTNKHSFKQHDNEQKSSLKNIFCKCCLICKQPVTGASLILPRCLVQLLFGRRKTFCVCFKTLLSPKVWL